MVLIPMTSMVVVLVEMRLSLTYVAFLPTVTAVWGDPSAEPWFFFY